LVYKRLLCYYYFKAEVLQFFVVVAVTLLIILALPYNIQLLECVYNEYKADTHH
jgi:hypothetical protein